MAFLRGLFSLVQIARPLLSLPFLLRSRGGISFFFYSFSVHRLEGTGVVGGGRNPKAGVGIVEEANGIYEDHLRSIQAVDAAIQEGFELVGDFFLHFLFPLLEAESSEGRSKERRVSSWEEEKSEARVQTQNRKEGFCRIKPSGLGWPSPNLGPIWISESPRYQN